MMWGPVRIPLANGYVDVYKDSARAWRWRRVSPNGRVIASSGEAFASRRNAIRAARKLVPPA